MQTAVSKVLADPTYIPHSLSEDRRSVIFLHCDPEKVASAAFIDGRTDISTGEAVEIPIADLVELKLEAHQPHRMLFHVGFCGSTLLSWLLAVPGRVRVLREPNILADLAGYFSFLKKKGYEATSFDLLVKHIIVLLHRPWQHGEIIVVKPSNWANNLLSRGLSRQHSTLPIFLTENRAAFLRAVFRGGPDRIAFTARAVVHLSASNDQDAHNVARSLDGGGEDIDRMARLAVLMHAIQLRHFFDAMSEGNWPSSHFLKASDLRTDPAGEAMRAANLLELNLSDNILKTNAQRWARRDAKAPNRIFSLRGERREDERVLSVQGECIDRALAWAAEFVGPENF